eukprot:ctg_3009.g378
MSCSSSEKTNMESFSDILDLVKLLLVSSTQDFRARVGQYEALQATEKDLDKSLQQLQKDVDALTLMEERLLYPVLHPKDSLTIGSENEHSLSSVEKFRQFLEIVESSEHNSSVLLEFVKNLRREKTEMNIESLEVYKRLEPKREG